MSDGTTVDNPTNGDYTVSTDDAGASGQVQRVKLAYSADGSATHIPADANGLLVNLGSNNDVTVTGTVAVGSALPAGNNNIGNVDVLSTVGVVAADASASSNVVVAGGRASLAVPSSVSADGDAVHSWLDRAGRSVVKQQSATGTHSSVAGSATSVTLLSASTSRLGASVYNDSTAILYVKLGSTASTSSFTVKLYPDDYFEVPFGYTGVVDGIWASAAGNARVVEFS